MTLDELQAARLVLQRYDVPVTDAHLIHRQWNTIYRIASGDGRTFALRIQKPNYRTPLEIRSELWWLRRLAEETGLGAPEPIHNRDGDDLTVISAPDVEDELVCVLFSWVPGQVPTGAPTPELARQLGNTLARLHLHSDTRRPPPEFSNTRMDRAWEFGRRPEIYGDRPDPLFTQRRRQVFQESAKRVGQALGTLYADPSNLRFLHADLHLGNVKLDGPKLRPIDFDDCLWGHAIQDIGVSLASLQRGAWTAGVAEAPLFDAFERGYIGVRPWPARSRDDVETFLAARMLFAINFLLRYPQGQRDQLEERIASYTECLRRWLSGGGLVNR